MSVDERLKVKSEEFTRPRIHRVVWGTGTPKDKDEVKEEWSKADTLMFFRYLSHSLLRDGPTQKQIP